MRGDAEAFALEAKGRAEAEQMAKKAEAFKQYGEGAMVDMLLEKLPLVSHTENRTGSTRDWEGAWIGRRIDGKAVQ